MAANRGTSFLRKSVKRLEANIGFLGVALLVALIPEPARSAEPIVVNVANPKTELGFHVDYLEDEVGSLSLDDILKPEVRERFTQSEVAVPSFGFTKSAYWFSFQLINQGRKATDRLLQLSYHFAF